MNRLFILNLVLLSISCRTTKPQQIPNTEADAAPVRVGADADGSIPNFLWSAERRRASAGYYYLVGEYKVMSGDIVGARNLFESAYNLDPNPFLGAKLIAADAITSDGSDAELEARRMVLLYPKSAQLHFLYAQVLTRSGKYKDAVKEIEEAIRFDPRSEEQYLFLADLHQMAKENLKATVVIKEYLQVNPTSVKALVRLARLQLFSDQKAAALISAEKAYELGSAEPETVLIYALCLDANGKSDRAVALYELLYRSNPDNQDIIARMVDLYRSLGNLEESLELLNEMANKSGTKQFGVNLQRGIILWELKRYEEAAKIFEALAEEKPDQDRMRYLAGIGNEKIKNFERALFWLEPIEPASEMWATARLRIAVIKREQKNFDGALNEIDAIESAGKGDSDTYGFAAGIHADKGDYLSALKKSEEGFKKFPDQSRFLFLQAVYLERLDRYEQTVKVLRQVIAKDPKNSAALNFLGYSFAERGENLSEAEHLIRKALELKPDDGYYLDSLGWVYYQRGDYMKAREYLEQAQAKTPNEGVVDEHLGDVFLKLEEPSKALYFYESALKKNLEAKERKRIEDKAKNLRKDLGRE
jgi:tetratricopeptide (TPR) repeat protein